MNLVFENLDVKIIDITHRFVIGLDDKEKVKNLFIKQSLIYREFLDATGEPLEMSLSRFITRLEIVFENLCKNYDKK